MDETIRQLVTTRRTALHGTDGGERPWGLALSGGGIRSATFCLGLLKALAAQGQLLRFDLLSTVSGGGYIGATLGRMCHDAASAERVREVERAFGEVDRVRLGAWLRANGRYLIPGGLRDVLFAAALYLRNLLGTHIELAIAASLAGMALAAVNLLAWDGVFRAFDPGQAQAVPLWVRWATQLPTLWLAEVGPWVVSVMLACAYWSVRDRRSSAALWAQLALWSLLGLAAAGLGSRLAARFGGPAWLTPVFVAFALCWVVALSWVLWRGRRRGAVEIRNQLTGALAGVLGVALAIALLGVLDRAGWWIAVEGRGLRVSHGAVLLALFAALRALLPLLLARRGGAPGPGKALLLALASACGLLLAFCLAAWWVGVVYAGVLLPVFTPGGLVFSRGWAWLVTFGAVVGGYALVTGRDLAFLNLSSLQMFYRARIVRGYLGAANARRLGGDPVDEVSGLALPQVPVGQVDPGDDLAQLHYAPHAKGGPVHLVNVCINQTHDPRQRLFNRDRKGLPLTVGPLGWMQAGGAAWQRARGDAALTLGAWTAISGAALGAGLGRMTHRGISALSVFAGLRLGYWWDSAAAGLVQRGAAARATGTLLMKTRFLLLECFGSFPGSSSARWYLSDGGHFENTGAYALLREKAALIVLADCGADPHYRFDDLENLVRRARIDLHAEVVFMKPRPGAAAPLPEAFGSLDDLASPTGRACLALARVRYESGASGTLVLVKPNVWATLPVDLVNFKADHPLFPQQPTTDQFFDEAQWESYFRLGAEIGARLDGPLLDRVALGADDGFVLDDGQGQALPPAPAGGASAPGAALAPPPAVAAGALGRLQARVLGAGAVTASVGLGTALAVGIAAWQGLDSWRAWRAETVRVESAALQEVAGPWALLRADAPGGDAPALLAAGLLRQGDVLCRAKEADAAGTQARLVATIVSDARSACAAAATQRRAPSCARLLDGDAGASCLQPAPAPACAPRYWARDYSGRTAAAHNCGGSGPERWPMVQWIAELLAPAGPSR